MCSEIRLISLKLAQCFVRRKLQLFTLGGTGAPRLSLRFFFRPEATDLQLYITVPEIIPTGLDVYSWMYRHNLRHRIHVYLNISITGFILHMVGL